MWGSLLELVQLGDVEAETVLETLRLPAAPPGIPDTGWDGAQQLQIIRYIGNIELDEEDMW